MSDNEPVGSHQFTGGNSPYAPDDSHLEQQTIDKNKWLLEDSDGHIALFNWMDEREGMQGKILLSLIQEDARDKDFCLESIGIDEDGLMSILYEGYQDLNYMWFSDLIEKHMDKLALATQGLIVEIVEKCAEDLIERGE